MRKLFFGSTRMLVLFFLLVAMSGCFARTGLMIISGEPAAGSSIPKKACVFKSSEWNEWQTTPIKSVTITADKTEVIFQDRKDIVPPLVLIREEEAKKKAAAKQKAEEKKKTKVANSTAVKTEESVAQK